ncbi:ExeM/NucH family extracellular endonuclease [bacterium]|nr:ExeM/NucH family extracellular endonuclease [bacterium]
MKRIKTISHSKMILQNMTIRASLLAAITITLLINAGCSTETPVSQNATEAKEETNGLSGVNSEPKITPVVFQNRSSDGNPVVIDGDLSSVDWSSLVGKDVTVAGDLVVVDTYDLLRRGQVKVARDRLYIPTSLVDPNDDDPKKTSYKGGSNVAKVVKAQKLNDKASIIIDDGSAAQNIYPPTLFPDFGSTLPTVRVGSKVKGVSGKLVKAGRVLLLVPNQPLQWIPAERPARPDVGDADVTVSSFNVLNYFTTIDNGSNDARGADSESEFKRQEAKIVSAIIALNADVIGLMEIENNIEAEQQLLAALNKEVGKDVFKGGGFPDGFQDTPGSSDAIRVAMIYRDDRVDTVGDVSTIDDYAFGRARAPIVQTFKSKSGGSPFTVIVNHFKSKGGASRADVVNKNKGDGQGAYNSARRDQALAICKFVDNFKQIQKRPRVLVIGDLNAYDQEDPIDALRASGLVDLQELSEEKLSPNRVEPHYSYLHYGQSGSLDHAFATKSLAEDVTGVATWHINADEPQFLDYNEEYRSKKIFVADPFRSSDHDPVLIGIRN